MGVIYLDHLAATPLHPQVKEAMTNHLETVFGNPSSDNQVGQPAAAALEKARAQVAALINAEPKEVVFNSGGTEANNHAIKGVAIGLREKGRHIITSNIEHKSVLNSLRTLRLLDYRVTSLDVDQYGLVDPAAVEKAITPETILISVMLANNEIGTIEPIADIAQIAQKHKIALHTDAVAATGIMPVDVQKLGVNLLSLSANQFYGPSGVGALYIRKGTPIWPLLDGGLQENKRRAGTENLIGIVGMGAAAEAAGPEMPAKPAPDSGPQGSPASGIVAGVSRKSRSTATPSSACPICFSVSVTYIEGESLMMLLEDEGIIVNTRSACASGSLRASHVLIGTGLDHALAQGTLVFTLGRDTTEADIDQVLEVMPGIVQTLRDMSPIYKKEHTG